MRADAGGRNAIGVDLAGNEEEVVADTVQENAEDHHPAHGIRGARGGSNELQDLTPAEELHLAPEIPAGSPYNVGQLYSHFAASIRGTANGDAFPDFDHAVGLHKFIDAIRQSSDEGRRIAVA